MDPTLMDKVANSWEDRRTYYNQINMFARDVQGRIGVNGIRPKNFWRDGISQDFHRFPSSWRFITDHLWFAYGRRGEEIRSKRGRYAFLAFCASEGNSPTVRVGYSFSPGDSPDDRYLLVDHADQIIGCIEGTGYTMIRAGWGFREQEAFTSEELQAVLTDEEILSGFDRLQLVSKYQTEALTDPYVTDHVAGELLENHEFVNGLIESRNS